MVMLLSLILITLTAAIVALWRLHKIVRWYANVSIPWFNNIGQKIGLDNARIPEPPVQA